MKPIVKNIRSSDPIISDVLVIGSGMSGLYVSILLANEGKKVILATKKLLDGSSFLAQGGIAAVTNITPYYEGDSIEQHIKDTLKAGSLLNDEQIVHKFISAADSCIKDLIDLGVPFSTTKNSKDMSSSNGQEYSLHKEGGHKFRRVWHCDDKSGEKISHTLLDIAKRHKNITILSNMIAIDLLCDNGKSYGASFGRINENEETLCKSLPKSIFYNKNSSCDGSEFFTNIQSIFSNHVILATGGSSSIYLHSTNTSGITGAGIAMAQRAGCNLSHMEFEQFHPTALYSEGEDRKFLITEALRGEGAILTSKNYRFMPEYDSRAELATRDIVSRAIVEQMKKDSVRYVELDLSTINKEKLKSDFPTIYTHCIKMGIDITKSKIPVVPAAHYTCGGIKVDENGQTNISALYAIGECAYTGLHGANRLASNSTLECLASARFAYKNIMQDPNAFNNSKLSPRLTIFTEGYNQRKWIKSQIRLVKKIIWEGAGIVRKKSAIKNSKDAIEKIEAVVIDRFDPQLVSPNLCQLRNSIQLAKAILDSAITRHKSVGGHHVVQ